jgi:hypothetical protein
MSLLDDWFEEHVKGKSVPLLREGSSAVSTITRRGRMTLERHPAFTELMVRTVEEGLMTDSWVGLVYIMHWLREGMIYPLYIGKAERRGVSQDLSFNITNIRKNDHAFGRWGYGLAYHLGDLSHAMFGGKAYKNPSAKYRRWAETLFTGFDPPVLREPLFLAIISWHKGMKGPSRLEGSVPSVEKELIALASAEYPDILLNVDGR